MTVFDVSLLVAVAVNIALPAVTEFSAFDVAISICPDDVFKAGVGVVQPVITASVQFYNKINFI